MGLYQFQLFSTSLPIRMGIYTLMVMAIHIIIAILIRILIRTRTRTHTRIRMAIRILMDMCRTVRHQREEDCYLRMVVPEGMSLAVWVWGLVC